jgi:hypothetical protein
MHCIFNLYKQDIPGSGGGTGNRNEKELMYSKARFVLNQPVCQFVSNIVNKQKLDTVKSNFHKYRILSFSLFQHAYQQNIKEKLRSLKEHEVLTST